MKYVLISPVRDEVGTILCTMASVLAQSVRPARYVIVDDGSSDGTSALVEQMARRYDFIRVVNTPNRGSRLVGPGVIRAFRKGLQEVEDIDWDFLGKLDGDIELPCRYYENVLSAFLQDSKLGIASGQCLASRNRSFRLEPNMPFHTRGPCKVYRRKCFEEIGGLRAVLGWDGLDGYQARMHGWRTMTLSELQVLHLTPTHTKEGWLRGAIKAGRGAYFQHYLPSYMLARVALNFCRHPYLIRGVGLGLGFVIAHAKREKRLHDPKLVGFIHGEQRRQLIRSIKAGTKGLLSISKSDRDR